MKWQPQWQTGWNIVGLGRAAGIIVIVAGLGLSAWNVLDVDNFGSQRLTEVRIRFFLQGVISYIASGGLLILAAEVADRLGWQAGESEQETE